MQGTAPGAAPTGRGGGLPAVGSAAAGNYAGAAGAAPGAPPSARGIQPLFRAFGGRPSAPSLCPPRRALLCLALLCLALLWSCAAAGAAARLEVAIEGVEGPLLTNVRRHLLLWRERKDESLDERRIHRLHAGAEAQIQAALRAFGHFRGQIEGELTAIEDGWRARYRITPGPVIPIGSADLRIAGAGAAEPALRRLLEGAGLSAGKPLDQGAYEALKHDLLATATELGYADARFTASRIDVRLDAYRADIELALDTGEAHVFGAVRIRQQGEFPYHPEFMRRFVTLEPGDPYRPQRLVALRTELLDSQYFTEVDVEPERRRARDNRIPVTIRTSADRTRKYRFGVGVSTDTGARVSASHSQVVNRGGHRFNAEARLAQRDQSALAEYRIPLADPAREYLAFTTSADRLDTDSRNSGILMTGGARHGVRAGWAETLGVKVEQEDFRVGGESDRTLLVMPHGRWQRSQADHPLFPRHGWRLGLELLTSFESLGSDIHFLQGRLEGKYILPLGDAGRLLLRGQAGATLTDGFDRMPASKRFYAGGDQSVRGYQFEELGPTNSKGQVEGGRNLVVGSLEFDHRITERWGAAIFADVGNAIDGFGDPLRTGVGIGIRLRTPIGPVRLDLARGLDNPDADFRIHLSLGPDL